MKKIFTPLIAGLCICLTACNHSNNTTNNNKEKITEHNELYFANNMEDFNIWNYNSSITKSNGYSGICFSKTDKENPYSFGLNAAIKDLTSKKISKADVKVMVSVANMDFRGGIVCSVFRNDSTIFWNSSDLKNFISEPAKWCTATGTFDLPKDLRETDRITIYVWNSGEKSDIYADDFEIQFYE